MAIGRQTFDQSLKQQAARALPRLDTLRRQGVSTITRGTLLEDTGMTDNELQKLIHDGNLPRHVGKHAGMKLYEVEPALKMLARYAQRYEYVVD